MHKRIKREHDKIISVDIFKFDHSLFDTPIPNYALFNNNSIKILTDRSPDNDLDWYKDPGILSLAGVHMKEKGNFPRHKMWNQLLCNISRHDLETWRVPVLYCDRQRTPAIETVINRLIQAEKLNFYSVEITDEKLEDVIHHLIQEVHPQEITYYANHDEKEDMIATYMQNVCPFIDYFRINVEFRYSFLDPYIEFKKVAVLINKHNSNMHSGSPVTMSASYFGTYFRITYMGKKLLLSTFVTDQFIPENLQSKLIFEASRVDISNRRLQVAETHAYGELETETHLNPLQIGCIPGIIYALKVSIEGCLADSFLYGEDPIVIIAYDPMIARSHLGLYVKQIPAWEPVDSSLEIGCTLRFEKILRIKMGDQ